MLFRSEINSTGGYVKQYQVLVEPDRLRYYKVSIQDVWQALARNNANTGGGVLPQRAEQYLVRGIGLVKDRDDIRNIVLKEVAGTPVYIRDVATVDFGEEVRFGDLAFTSIPTPGHSHDHHSWLVAAPEKRYLVSGDALFAGGRLALQHIWDCSIPDAIASVERIAEHDFDALLPGHFVFTMEGARRHVDAALDVIARLGCPASVL